MILYRAGSCIGIEDRHVEFTVSAGTYSNDGFNRKVKAPVLLQKQHWEAPQIQDLKNYIFIASNNFFA